MYALAPKQVVLRERWLRDIKKHKQVYSDNIRSEVHIGTQNCFHEGRGIVTDGRALLLWCSPALG